MTYARNHEKEMFQCRYIVVKKDLRFISGTSGGHYVEPLKLGFLGSLPNVPKVNEGSILVRTKCGGATKMISL